ncbi:hypothetical protein [Nonomuraea gerenzanensis]|uniref:Uncharacterized protein n=1 Tax=Nonomuraea gerenzanensis TaxID=93944 RepID=A0A1M4E361_9ACTN|nr:hypothetical protein [Nonomuraea gerenzanensis]UBU15495.1 hypothetical protein LCN96_10875 [Nonomuraea gerenzanensis]SBO93257.1 hypothetical protein BN4615_P2771 [Nonomuraea gerenzanensis]
MNELSNLARVRDEQLSGRASGAGARALFDAITAESPEALPAPARPRRRARRLLVSVAAATALAAGVTVVNVTGGATVSYASAELDITREGGEWVARIKDPYAEHDKFTRGFAAVGLDVRVQIVPTSPSRAGKMLQLGGSGPGMRVSTGTEPESCEAGRPGCALVIRVPVGAAGGAWVKFGRLARPGEAYDLPGRANAAGEPLEGVVVSGRTVGEMREEARRRGVRVVLQVITPQENYEGYSIRRGEKSGGVRDDWFVWEAESVAADVVRLLVTEERLPKSPVYGDMEPPVG